MALRTVALPTMALCAKKPGVIFLRAAVLITIYLAITGAAPGRVFAWEKPEWPYGWSGVRDLGAARLEAGLAIDLTTGGNVVVFYGDGEEGKLTVYRSVFDPKAPGEPLEKTRVSSESGRVANLQVVTDSAGYEHVVWQNQDEAGGTIHYSRFGSGGTQVVGDTVVARVPGLLSSLTVSAGNPAGPEAPSPVDIIWSDWSSGELLTNWLSVGEDGKVSGGPERLAAVPPGARRLRSVNWKGKLHIVWTSGIGLFYTALDPREPYSAPGSGQPSAGPLNLGSFYDGEKGSPVIAVAPGPSSSLRIVWTSPVGGAYGVRETTLNYAALDEGGRLIAGPIEAVRSGSFSIRPSGSVTPAGDLNIVWSGDSSGLLKTYFASISPDGRVRDSVKLDVSNTSSVSPVIATDREGHNYVVWLSYHTGEDGLGTRLNFINTRYPENPSVWRRVGLDENGPVYDLAFLTWSSLMYAVLYFVFNFAIVIVGIAFIRLFGWAISLTGGDLRRAPVLAMLAMFSIMWLAEQTPLMTMEPGSWELSFSVLTAALASGVALLCGKAMNYRWVNEGWFQLVLAIVWFYLEMFFTGIPRVMVAM